MRPIEDLPILEAPYEIYEFQPNIPAFFKVSNWRMGKMTIIPRWAGAPPTKIIEAVRIYVDEETKPFYPPYYDITPRRLVSQLSGMMKQPIPRNMWLKILRDVPGPRAHFSASWIVRE